MHATDELDRPLHILWVTTKSPWPAHDGGRLLMDATLRALDPGRVRVTLVFPVSAATAGAVVDDAGRPPCLDRVEPVAVDRDPRRSISPSRPFTASRHRIPAVRAAVVRLLLEQSFDVVHAEQPHALENIPRSAPPVLLRTQNVERDLWRQIAWTRSPPLRWALQIEALRIARWERTALRRVQCVAAISFEDRDRLARLAGPGGPPIEVIRPAMPDDQPSGPVLDGDPALTLFASSSWGPNRDGARAFLDRSWPRILAALPSCRLHVFGGDASVAALDGVRHHAAPFATEAAFATGALVVVPVRAASGVRMKILDAWSRGLAVVTTQKGALGLGASGSDVLQPVDDLRDLHSAVLRLADGEAAEEQVRLGREWLRRNAQPAAIGSAFLAAYRGLAVANSARSPSARC